MTENLIEDRKGVKNKAPLLTEPEQKNQPAYNFYIPSEDAPIDERNAFLKALGVPDDAKEYKIEIKNKLIASDPEVNKKLRDLGFTQKQVQAVYDLAVEKVIPVIHELARDYEAQGQLERLMHYFGGEERWNEVSRQISSWAKQNLTKDVYEALASSYEGVTTLYSMMNSKEPTIGAITQGYTGIDSEESLKKLMQSEKYWRDKDPATLKRVVEGFKRLYPNN